MREKNRHFAALLAFSCGVPLAINGALYLLFFGEFNRSVEFFATLIFAALFLVVNWACNEEWREVFLALFTGFMLSSAVVFLLTYFSLPLMPLWVMIVGGVAVQFSLPWANEATKSDDWPRIA